MRLKGFVNDGKLEKALQELTQSSNGFLSIHEIKPAKNQAEQTSGPHARYNASIKKHTRDKHINAQKHGGA